MDPTDADCDGDGLDDGSDIAADGNPTLADTDGDGLSDLTEVKLGLDPADRYTAGEGASDPQSVVNASLPGINLQTNGAPHQLGFTALPYVSDDVLFSPDLYNWQVLTQLNANAQPTPQSIPEPVAGSPKGFFNLKPH
jgi:hypothetical protein